MQLVKKLTNIVISFSKNMLHKRAGFIKIVHVINLERKDEFFRKSLAANIMLALLLAELIYNKLNPTIMVQYMSTLSIGVPIIEIIGFFVVGVLFICLKWYVFTKNIQSGSRTMAFLYSFVSIMKSFSVNAIIVSIFYSIILITHTSHLFMHKGILKFLILNGIVTVFGIYLILLVDPISSIISGIRLAKIKSCY